MFIAKRISLLLGAALLAAPLAAQNITGSVTDKTTNKPAAGDAVVLIKLGNGMQEGARAVTDSRGHFSLPVDDAGMHLVRVTHDKVPYFKPAPQGTTSANVDVYDSAEKVNGITGAANVIRLQAQGNTLEATELFAVNNASSPPKTQFGARAFELYLPAQAEIISGAALSPGGMPLQASPVPTGEPGHYAFVFPIRPGETRFQLAYKLPYSGIFSFTPRLSLPMENLAVMLPKSMNFVPAAGAPYQPVNDDVNAQLFLIKNAKPSQTLAFTVSGMGMMPNETAGNPDTSGPAGDATTAGAAADNRPGGGLGNPIDTPDALKKYRWWILGGIAVLFAAGIAFAMRRPAAPQTDAATVGSYPAHVPAAADADRRDTLLQTLKDELFTLETDRLEGRISEEQYAAIKAALETVLRYALQRIAEPAAASNS